METKKDSPGVYVPPPLIYAAIFLISILMQRYLPVNPSFFKSEAGYILGWSFIAVTLFLLPTSMIKFFKTKNTLILIKPANSLQTNGIYSVTRNPMYLGLSFLYIGIGLLIGNWWTFILMPVLIFIINNYVIKKEEQYLLRAFGSGFTDYKLKTRRWI